MRSRLTLLLLLFVGLAGERAICAQPTYGSDPRHLDGAAYGERVDLSQNWLFAPDDRPDYASASLDDSGWKQISTQKDLSFYGYRNLPYCWYRLHVHLSPAARDVAVGVQSVVGAYELYANGVKVGGLGSMASHALQIQPRLIAYPIPASVLTASQGNLVLALRFVNQSRRYITRGYDTPLGPSASVFLESDQALANSVSYRATHLEVVNLALGGMDLLIGLVALALYLALRSQPEYLAIAINSLAAAVDAGLATWHYLRVFTLPSLCLANLFEAVEAVAIIEFVRLVLGWPRTRLWLAIEILAVLGPLLNPLASAGLSPVFVIFAAYFVSLLVVDVILPLLLLRGWLRGNLDARVLLPAVLMGTGADYYSFFLQAMYYFHFSANQTQWALYIGTYRVNVGDLGTFAFDITILIFLVLRTIRIARERAEAAGEIEAAQTTQQLLLARASQATPGFTVESVYLPASEVGGDFFLVSPGPDGSLIAIVGDVSGKGLIAAMRVSMILGVLRRENSRDPAIILNQLNEALLTQGEMGFTTACCVRLELSGLYTLANAGHISPYLDGSEIVAPPALPLGLTSQQSYEPVTGTLRRGEKLVLMSDGVVEARSAGGELYGFDRLPTLTRMKADEIAGTAQRFGQEDDITVLTIACCV